MAIVNSTNEKVGVEVSGPTLTHLRLAAVIGVALGVVMEIIGAITESPASMGFGAGLLVSGIYFLISLRNGNLVICMILKAGDSVESLVNFEGLIVSFHKLDSEDRFFRPSIATIDFTRVPPTITYLPRGTAPLIGDVRSIVIRLTRHGGDHYHVNILPD